MYRTISSKMGLREHPSRFKNDLYKRVQKLLVSQEWSDCTFSISGKIFKVHKLILAMSSPVFQTMLYGPWTASENIEITDIQPDIFQLMLNFIYTDDVEIDSIDKAFELLYASRKYMLELLILRCIEYIQTHIDVDNVFDVFTYPEHLQDKKIVESACKLFCGHPQHLFQEKNRINCLCLKTVLKSDHMNIVEKDLIKHVFEWSSHYCEQNNISDTVENRRNVLVMNGLLQLLRFLTLSVNELAEIVNDSWNLLLPFEVEAIMKRLQYKDKRNDVVSCVLPIGPNPSPRKELNLSYNFCYRSPIRCVAPVIIDSMNCKIESRIKISTSVFIYSFTIPTRIGPPIDAPFMPIPLYLERISLVVQRECDNSSNITEFSKSIEYNLTTEITLKEPYLFKKNEWYKISLIWHNDGLVSTYPVEHRESHFTAHRVTIDFDDLPIISSGRCWGSFIEGLKFAF